MVDASHLVIQEGTAEGALGALAASDTVGLGRELGLPLGVGLDHLGDLLGCGDAAVAIAEADGDMGGGGIVGGHGRGGARRIMVAGDEKGQEGEGGEAHEEEVGGISGGVKGGSRWGVAG